ncbi:MULTISPECIES: hypothetical protein [unclassified Endozoicomonas]|uniref:hypothetical protein n=1 Tax=unclassified Endozoicomonas TaxID=2644528 RepID=UPI003BB7B84E
MYIIKPFKCAFLALAMSCSQVWAETRQINSYIALKDALEQGEVPVIGVIDFGQCTHKYQNLKHKSQALQSFRGKEVTIFKRNTINEDGSIMMLTSYKLNTSLVAEVRDGRPLPDWIDWPAWIEWQSAYALSRDNDTEFNIWFIAADAKTGKTLETGRFTCPFGSAVKLWCTPHS